MGFAGTGFAAAGFAITGFAIAGFAAAGFKGGLFGFTVTFGVERDGVGLGGGRTAFLGAAAL
jgi:hypothetical protein